MARRAGIGKAATYRRCATKQEMVFAAAVHGETLEVPPDTGSLHGDLAALARVIIGHLTNPASSALLNLLGEIANNPALAANFIEPEREGNAELLRRAVRRGDLEHLPDIEVFHAVSVVRCCPGCSSPAWTHMTSPNDSPASSAQHSGRPTNRIPQGPTDVRRHLSVRG